MQFDAIESVLAFGLGVVASIVASYVYALIEGIRAGREKLRIKGVWGEYIAAATGRQYSLGKLYFDIRRKIHAFDGTNFNNDGTPYCQWETVTSFVDTVRRQYFYTFTAKVSGERDRLYYGFGVTKLVRNERDELVPADGYYVSASVDAEPRTHSMLRFPKLKYSGTMDGKSAISAIDAASVA